MLEQDKNNLQEEIKRLEKEMSQTDFWQDKAHAQATIQKYNDLKLELAGESKLDQGGAVLNILAGAGGEDSEDFVRMLLNMYLKYLESQGWTFKLLHENQNESGGYRNISLEVLGKQAYGKLKNESGVHRLVRISPFNAKAKRHTSFAMVEVLPILDKLEFQKFREKIKPEDIEIEFSKASGPGGQNVNKRETAVRVIYKPKNISVAISTERSQVENRETALALLYAKLYKLEKEAEQTKQENLQISKTTNNEWGSQIRNYVLHPYKLVKDLRTGVETSDIEKVLEKGELEEFITAEKSL